MTFVNFKLDTKDINDKILKILEAVFTNIPILFDIKEYKVARNILDMNRKLDSIINKIQNIL